MYDELADLIEQEEFRSGSSLGKNFIDTLHMYISKMLKDKNQINYQKSNPGD